MSPILSRPLLIAGILAHGTVSAQEWEYVGPRNFMADLEAMGDKVQAPCTGGVWTSVDQGATFTHTSCDPFTLFLNDGDVQYARDADGVLERTTDAGMTWTHFDPPVTGSLDFASDGHVVAARAEFTAYTSADRGATWDTIALPYTLPLGMWGVPGVLFLYAAYHPGLIDEDHRMFRSLDSGVTWDTLAPNIPDIGSICMVNGTIVARLNAWIGGPSPVCISNDLGSTWQLVLTDAPSIVASADGFVYFKGGIDGRSLLRYALGDPALTDISGFPLAAGDIIRQFAVVHDHLIVTTGLASVYTSSDRGSSWTLNATHGAHPVNVNRYSVKGDRISTSSSAGLQLSRNGGTSYGPFPMSTTDQPSTLVCFLPGRMIRWGGPIVISDDDGTTWNETLDAYRTQALCPSPEGLFAATAGPNVLVAPGQWDWAGPLVRSQDDGATWDTLALPPMHVSFLLEHDGELIIRGHVLGEAPDHVIHHAPIDGTSWSTREEAGLPASLTQASSFFLQHDTLWVSFLGADQTVPHVHYSLDLGDSWSPMSTGLPGGVVYDMVAGDGGLFAVVEDGIFRLDQAHQQWYPLQPQPPCGRGYGEFLALDGEWLYSTVGGDGLWRIKWASLAEPPSAGGLHLLYPNPSQGRLSITGPWNGETADIAVMDAAGRLVQAFHSVNTTRELDLDLSDLANGTYVLGLSINGERTTQHIALIGSR